MGIIKLMDETLSNKIAAGEVVEKISNVVKELVENSIDAGSKTIKVELISSGIKEIRVIDDGSGMEKDDAVLSFSRHATSKVKNETDLYFINTLGFRGEALASIASVSRITLETSKQDNGTKVIIEGGKLIDVEEGVSHKGTIVTVSDIFYNTPVRLKFLKSEQTELSYSVSIIEKIAFSHPEISFSLSNNGEELIKTTGSNDLLKVIHEILGYSVSKNMQYIKGENYDYSITGYISNINIYKSTKSKIITFINNRVVQNQTIIRIIKDAYHTFLPDNKYPVCVINIETDPTLIDVNVHPTKQDIKFSKLETLEELLFNLIRVKLNNTDNTYSSVDENVSVYKENIENTEIETNYLEPQNFYKEVSMNLNVEEKKEDLYESELEEKSLIKPVGITLGTYLVCQNIDTMFLIDIHAANERINFEYFLESLKNEKPNTISLLFPISIEFTKEEYLILDEYKNIINEVGIKYEEFGINTLRILSHPVWLKNGYEEECIRKIFDLIIELKDKFDRVRFNDRVAMTLACKSSVKANTNISYGEQETLINRLFKCEFPYTCPHGRPTIIKYPKYELEKLFKRVD